ncbi:MAG: MotA/TolQ/ExbB proton channel family protein [Kiritimatiellae bacterium]|nr:MotA/TolQ/ExbB proton channel family protein [Kiritimatiellia bacterium]
MIFDLFTMGGPVLWIICAGGALAFGVFIERALHLHRARIKYDDFLKGIINNLGRKNISEVVELCEDTPGPVAHIVKTAILHRDESKANLWDIVDNAATGEVSRMERRLVVLATVAQLTPLLGLLGTVMSIVDSLLVMQGNAPLIYEADMMSAFMRALITTAGGLMVAIPCYAAFNLLVIKMDRLVLDMDRASSEIIAFLTNDRNHSTDDI